MARELTNGMVELAARTAHEVNRVYCEGIGDNSQPKWEDAPDWQKDSAKNGVRKIWDEPLTPPDGNHQSWMAQKEAEGWTYGPVKDPAAKRHPCMLPFSELPLSQRAKDYLFAVVVRAVLGIEIV